MIILCADDYGLTDGISRAIEELARLKRISATSAIVTEPDWQHYVGRLSALRSHIAVGVHLNLTLGSPLGFMPMLVPTGKFPTIGSIITRALLRRLDHAEIEAEFIRQFKHFETTTGIQPDHVDGHQHVHALPGIRDALIAAITAMNWPTPPLVRTPADGVFNILRRGQSITKALIINILSSGLRARLDRTIFPTNDSFAGFSAFNTGSDYRDELAANLVHPNLVDPNLAQPSPVHPGAHTCDHLHIVMCHPGYADEALRARDPVVERREDERQTLADSTGLPPRIWHPRRLADDDPIDWSIDRKIHTGTNRAAGRSSAV